MSSLFPISEVLSIVVFAAALASVLAKAAPRRQPIRIRSVENRRR